MSPSMATAVTVLAEPSVVTVKADAAAVVEERQLVVGENKLAAVGGDGSGGERWEGCR